MSRAHLGHFKKYFDVHIYFLLVNSDARRESWKLVVAEITNFLPIFSIPFFIRDSLFYQIYDHPGQKPYLLISVAARSGHTRMYRPMGCEKEGVLFLHASLLLPLAGLRVQGWAISHDHGENEGNSPNMYSHKIERTTPIDSLRERNLGTSPRLCASRPLSKREIKILFIWNRVYLEFLFPAAEHTS